MLEAGRRGVPAPARPPLDDRLHGRLQPRGAERRAARAEAATEIITNFVEGALLNHVTTPSDDFLEARFRPLLTDLVAALDSGLPRVS